MAVGRRNMSDLDSPNGPASTGRSAVQRAALAVGAVFLLLGVLGFVPGVTRNLWSMSLVGHRSGALLFGVFQVSILLNLMHLAFGVAGVWLARTMSGAHRYLLLGGAFYLVLFVYGMIVSQGSEANFVPVNPADDILHLCLGVAMVLLGATLSRRVLITSGRPI
jgi:Domain of unknown function (DUF4383)